MTKRLILLSLILVSSLQAQNPKSDSLITAGFKYLDAYAQSQDLGDARNAHRAFSEVLKKTPNNARAHLGLGLAYAAVEKQQLDPLGLNDATRPVNNTMAIRHLIEALNGDIDVGAAARAITTIARREYDVARMQEAVAGLEKAAKHNDAVRAAIAELYIAMYDPAHAEQVVANASNVTAKRQLAIAQLLQPSKVDRGGTTYLDALAAADSAHMIDFTRDARWVADADEAERWTKMSTPELRQHLAVFWQRRATTAGVPVAQRLATHFTRVQHAMQEFSYYRQREGTRAGKTINTQMSGLDYDVDDRAFTYVRYGEPDERISTSDGQYPPNQTWVYRRVNAKPLAFDYFLLPMDAHGWTLVADVVRCRGGSLPYSEQYLRDRMAIDPRYGKLLAECTTNGARAPDLAAVQAIALPFTKERTDSLNKAVVRDHGVPPTKKNIPLLADVVQFDASNGNTDVTAVVTWPFNSLKAVDGIVSLKLAFDVTDTLTGSVETRDTVLRVRIPPGNDAATGRMYLRASLKSGPNRVYHIRANDLNDPAVITIAGDPIEVRKFGSESLMMSDVALVAGEGGSWTRNGRKFSLLPRGAAAKTFSVYYEVYGVLPNAKYKTTVRFTPQDQGLAAIVKKMKGKEIVSFSFDAENQTNEPLVRELRALQSELPPGMYRLDIEVDSNGKVARSSRLVVIPQ